MTIRTANDHGDVWWDDSAGKCYVKTANQPSLGDADTSPGAGDELDLDGITFNSDYSSPYDNTWTACQLCVAQNIAANNSETAVTDSAVATVFTAPADGEMRIWVSAASGYFGVYVNDVYVRESHYSDNAMIKARAVRLNSGDVVKIGSNDGNLDPPAQAGTIYCIFRPDVYPAV